MKVVSIYFRILLAGGILVVEVTGQSNFATFQASELICVIGNNAASGEHRQGFNGIFSLTTPAKRDSVFVPRYAGVNLEHFFDRRPTPTRPEVLFEPRHSPMLFRKLSDRRAELLQPSTPVFEVESRTLFELKDPYYIDIKFKTILHRKDYEGGFLGIFWASYINAPLNKSVYFISKGATLEAPRWVQFASQVHGRDSTVRSSSDNFDLAMSNAGDALYANISPLRYHIPFFYGHFRDMVLIYIFRPNPHLRFAHSPSGGSLTTRGDDTNPAWDHQLIVPDPVVGKNYELEMRIVYKPWAGRDDVLREVRRWLYDDRHSTSH
jgi:hypothetical protein